MKTPQAHKWLAALAALTCLAASPTLNAQAAAGSGSLHIGVFVEDIKGAPISHLDVKNFTVSNQGAPLPFQLVHPALHPDAASDAERTRMLIILAPSIPDSAATLNNLLPELDSVWQRGWQVAAVMPNGNHTSYVTNREQLMKLCAAATKRPQQQFVKAAASNDVRHLNFFTGRRLVLYLTRSTGQKEMPPEKLLTAAKQVMAQLLVVNGGDLVWEPGAVAEISDCSNTMPSLFGGSAASRAAQSSTPPAYRSNCLGSYTKVSKQDDWYLFVAMNTHTAIREAIRSANGYYSLRIPRASLVTLPPGTPLSIKINLFDVQNYTATAIAYGKDNPPQILLTKK
jgi:hypothetical protein